jgi:membrane-associated phospholipid phosphatase
MSEQKNEKNVEIIEEAHQAARAESEPPHVRRYRAILFQVSLVLVAGAFGVLTFLVKTMPFFAVDLQITRSIQMITYPYFAELMYLASWLGYNPQNVIIALLMVMLIYGFGLHWEAVMALVAGVFSGAVNLLVKDLIQRPRPTPGSVNVIALLNSYSFPSGHVMFYLVFWGFIAFLAFTLLKPSITRGFILTIISILIILIGPSRIYLGEHWASDVLGAYLLGSLTLIVTIQFYVWGKTRFFVRQPVAATKTEGVHE